MNITPDALRSVCEAWYRGRGKLTLKHLLPAVWIINDKHKMKNKMIIATIIATYLIFLWDCKITYTNKTYEYKIKYEGLLWVGLDYWSIWRYNSNDKPMKWLDWKREVI